MPFVFLLDGMGDKWDEFDTLYSIQTAEDKEYRNNHIR